MCGICGFAGIRDDGSLLRRMTDSIRHRGPDDEGHFSAGSIGLGIRRLSIIDVEGGKQPIFNEDRTLVLVFNGEIYNHRELRTQLERGGHQFASHSDGETIIHLYEEYGDDCVDHLRGMFAFAIYDTVKDRLFIARDRLGIKPLYYWQSGETLVFGSEIKSLLEYEGITRTPDLQAIDAYMSLRYVPGPGTLFQGIKKLPAAHRLVWENQTCAIEPYWKLTFTEGGPYESDQFYQDRFDDLLDESVRMRMIADVPLGGFLSGGLDSSASVATMSKHSDLAVQTFSVGFDWEGDELNSVRELAAHIPIDSHEVICKPDDMELLPKIVWHLDEPVGDAIVLPLFLLSRMARDHVKVVLSGEGADETLAGYVYHRVMMQARRYADMVPGAIRSSVIEPVIAAAPLGFLNTLFDYPAALGKRGKQKVLDYHALLGERNFAAEHLLLTSLFDERDKSDLYTPTMKQPENRWAADQYEYPHATSDMDRLLSLHYAHWLPDVILTKQDKMSMANSVEARVPFLDHKLVEFLATVPPHLKLGSRRNKVLLRNYTAGLLPANFARQPKKAFYIPLDQYMGTPYMRELISETLSPESIRKRGYFDPAWVAQLIKSQSGEEFLFAKQVFALVMLELWHRIFIDRETGWVSS